jgi:erythromycin esterase-like protein
VNDVLDLRRAPDPVTVLRARTRPVAGRCADDDALLARVRGHQLVLLGEASHGTEEFYAERAALTRRLIESGDVHAVAIEGDWPDAYRVNRYVLGQSVDPDAEHALRGFQRFPTWMWRNHEVRDFVEWLHGHNARRPPEERVRFYGLDLYSLAASMDAVIRYLDAVDPEEAARARSRYGCFDRFGGAEGQSYGYALAYQGALPCQDEVVSQLVALRARTADYVRRDGMDAFDEAFFAEQNAVVVRDAEEYYQQMYRADVSSWNLRDRHMANTTDALLEHLGHRYHRPAIAVWEHNSHVGDARATGMGARGELNVGQLARQRYGAATVLVGFTTFAGEVTAARDWGARAERRTVRPARFDSFEALFHEVGGSEKWWIDCRDPGVRDALAQTRLERAIGVIYRPETERQSHYFPASIADQFDVVVHIDTTHAVHPLEPTEDWLRGEPPETYPTGL